MSFLPSNYKVPQGSSQFMKFIAGDNKFRALSAVVIGWEGWKGNKPFRRKEDTIKPEEVDLNQNGNPNINHFWAFTVWDYAEKKVRVLSITQLTVMSAIQKLVEDPEWGDPQTYDLTVTRDKKGDKTSYSVRPSPQKPITQEMKEALEISHVDLEKLFENSYPMAQEEVKSGDIPF